jgi:hypothetical protein
MKSALKEREREEEEKALLRRNIPIGSVGGGYQYDMSPNAEWWQYKTLIR